MSHPPMARSERIVCHAELRHSRRGLVIYEDAFGVLSILGLEISTDEKAVMRTVFLDESNPLWTVSRW